MHIVACKNTQLIIDFSGKFVLNIFFPFVVMCLLGNSLIWVIACSSVISRDSGDGHCWLSTLLFPAPESSRAGHTSSVSLLKFSWDMRPICSS